MRILFLSRWYPYPPDNGSKVRVFGLLRGLCELHAVSLISFHEPSDRLAPPPASAAPADVRVCLFRGFEPSSVRALAGYLSTRPRFLIDTHSAEMDRLIREAVRRTRYDLVIASQVSMAAYCDAYAGIPSVFDEVELGIYRGDDLRSRSPLVRARRRMTWSKHRRYMAGLLRNFRACTVASEVERGLLAAAVPGCRAIHVVPNAVDAESRPENPQARVPDSLIFTGSLEYAPNRHAVEWFASRVLPAIRLEHPNACLTVTGAVGPRTPVDLPGVVLTGLLPDVRSALAAASVSIAPIFEGGGTRLKILEAMATRTPVVATSRAAEGLELADGEHLLLADSPEAFRAAVLRVLEDREFATGMANRAWALCRERYDSRVVVPRFLKLVDEAAA